MANSARGLHGVPGGADSALIARSRPDYAQVQLPHLPAAASGLEATLVHMRTSSIVSLGRRGLREGADLRAEIILGGEACVTPPFDILPPMRRQLDPGCLRFSVNGCGADTGSGARTLIYGRARVHALGAVVGVYRCTGAGGLAGVAMGEADAGTPSFEMTWNSTTSSGYCSQEDSDSELEQYFTARTSLARRPRRDQVGTGG